MLREASRPQWLAADLRGELDLVPYAGPLREPPAEQFLALAAVAARVLPEGVAVRSVDPGATRVDVGVEQVRRRSSRRSGCRTPSRRGRCSIIQSCTQRPSDLERAPGQARRFAAGRVDVRGYDGQSRGGMTSPTRLPLVAMLRVNVGVARTRRAAAPPQYGRVVGVVAAPRSAARRRPRRTRCRRTRRSPGRPAPAVRGSRIAAAIPTPAGRSHRRRPSVDARPAARQVVAQRPYLRRPSARR